MVKKKRSVIRRPEHDFGSHQKTSRRLCKVVDSSSGDENDLKKIVAEDSSKSKLRKSHQSFNRRAQSAPSALKLDKDSKNSSHSHSIKKSSSEEVDKIFASDASDLFSSGFTNKFLGDVAIPRKNQASRKESPSRIPRKLSVKSDVKIASGPSSKCNVLGNSVLATNDSIIHSSMILHRTKDYCLPPYVGKVDEPKASILSQQPTSSESFKRVGGSPEQGAIQRLSDRARNKSADVDSSCSDMCDSSSDEETVKDDIKELSRAPSSSGSSMDTEDGDELSPSFPNRKTSVVKSQLLFSDLVSIKTPVSLGNDDTATKSKRFESMDSSKPGLAMTHSVGTTKYSPSERRFECMEAALLADSQVRMSSLPDTGTKNPSSELSLTSVTSRSTEYAGSRKSSKKDAKLLITRGSKSKWQITANSPEQVRVVGCLILPNPPAIWRQKKSVVVLWKTSCRKNLMMSLSAMILFVTQQLAIKVTVRTSLICRTLS